MSVDEIKLDWTGPAETIFEGCSHEFAIRRGMEDIAALLAEIERLRGALADVLGYLEERGGCDPRIRIVDKEGLLCAHRRARQALEGR